jgi:site-specific recombinase XerD
LEYDRQVAEWLARGRRPLDRRESAEITCVELIAAYKKFAQGYYRKNGEITNEVTAILSAAKFVRQVYGRELVNDFGPLKLQAVQQAMIREGWARKHINKQISRIVRMFAWGVSQELVKADVAQALREVRGSTRAAQRPAKRRRCSQ